MQAFVGVVDQGGFTGAAERLGLSKSAISKQVSALEARLGARLLNRTTRRVTPTEIGLLYYDRVRQVLADATAADQLVSAHQASPRGQLRLSAPVSFGNCHLSPVIADFLKAHPDVSIDLVLDDRVVDLIARGFDLAVRIGSLADSALMARRIAASGLVLVASPEYLAARGTPERIEDLVQHDLLHYTFASTGNFWRIRARNGEERQVRIGGQLAANNGDILLEAAAAGLGIAQVPTFLVGDALSSGRLERVLADHEQPLIHVHAVYPPGRYVQPKTRAFIDFLVERFRGIDPMEWPRRTRLSAGRDKAGI